MKQYLYGAVFGEINLYVHVGLQYVDFFYVCTLCLGRYVDPIMQLPSERGAR